MSSTVPSCSHGIDTRTDNACTGSCIPYPSTPSGTIETVSLITSASTGPDDRLQLGVRVEAEHSAVASDTAPLRTAERRVVVALRRVDPDVAGAQPFADTERPGG